MRKLLNTLYVTTPEAYLSKDGLNVVVSVKQQEVFRIPVINIEEAHCHEWHLEHDLQTFHWARGT